MKIRPVILCGGAGTRLWPNSKNHQAKQFIDFGSWTLLEKRRLKSNPIARELRTTKYKPHKIQNKKKLQERKRVKIKI